MNWAYQQTTGRSTAKAVLVALANQADQSGKCWPSVDYLMQRTELGRRAVIGNLGFLEDTGLISKVIRGGTGEGRKTNVYTLNMQSAADALSPPNVQEMHKGQCADNDTKKGGNVQIKQGQCAADAHKQSKNNQSKKNNQKTIAREVEIPDWLDEALFVDFVEHRKQMKKPLTGVALSRLIPSLTRLRDAGHDPNEALERSIANGWQGVFAPDRKGGKDPPRTGTDSSDGFWKSYEEANG